MNAKKQNLPLSNEALIRACAALMVVAIHVGGLWYRSPHEDLRLASIIAMGISRPAVPLFAMLSGALIFSKEQNCPGQAAVRRFLRVFLLLGYFGIFFYLYDTFMLDLSYPFYEVFLRTGTHVPLWYLFALLPIYTLSPYISLPLGKKPAFYRNMALWVFFFFLATAGIKGAPFYWESDYGADPLFLYLLWGFALSRIPPQKGLGAALGYLGCSAAIIFLEYGNHGQELFYGYATLGVLVQSYFLFRFLLSWKVPPVMHRVADFIGQRSVGIYGWHFLLITPLQSFWQGILPSGLAFMAVLYGSTLLLALVLASVFSAQIRVVKRLLSKG